MPYNEELDTLAASIDHQTKRLTCIHEGEIPKLTLCISGLRGDMNSIAIELRNIVTELSVIGTQLLLQNEGEQS
jgi:hypothetical protein